MNRGDSNTLPIDLRNMTLEIRVNGNVSPYEVQEQRQQRVSLGMCATCGQQLYRRAKKSFLRLVPNDQKVPLTIPQLVERGQCLVCKEKQLKQETPAMTARHSATPAVSCATHRSDDTSFSSKPADDILPITAVYQGPRNCSGQKDTTGEKDVEGVVTWANGDVYRGQFRCDQRHGHGTLEFASGGEYVGDWHEGQMHGYGTRRFANGDVYTGPYFRGQREGQKGRFYYANGDLYWGTWVNNKMHDESGRYYYASGQRFEGTFVASRRQGKGKLQRKDGVIEIFQYVNDQRVGQGVRWSTDRSTAWRLWVPQKKRQYHKQRIAVAEAVALVYEIEQAALTADDGVQ